MANDYFNCFTPVFFAYKHCSFVDHYYCTVSLAIGADGSYYKYTFNANGDCHRDAYCKFLQMTDV